MKSPGHQQWPDHKVREQRIDGEVVVRANGQVIADSRDVIAIEEDEHPVRYYFPRQDVKARLARTPTTSECPFKGRASYYDVSAGGETLHDAVWSYEDPYDEHRAIKDRVAFYDDKVPQLQVKRVG